MELTKSWNKDYNKLTMIFLLSITIKFREFNTRALISYIINLE
jgi:hypothetical protein